MRLRGARVSRAYALHANWVWNAEPLVVADEPEIGVDETVVAVAGERNAQAVVVGSHAHGPIVGSIVRGVIRRAPCLVMVVREQA